MSDWSSDPVISDTQAPAWSKDPVVSAPAPDWSKDPVLGNKPDTGPNTLVPSDKFIQKALGVPYKMGTAGPDKYDCSGFTCKVYAAHGINFKSPATPGDGGRADAQWRSPTGQKVDVLSGRDDLRPYDQLFFEGTNNKGPGVASHTGVYIGNGKFVHASSTAGRVVISDFNDYPLKLLGVKRYDFSKGPGLAAQARYKPQAPSGPLSPTAFASVPSGLSPDQVAQLQKPSGPVPVTPAQQKKMAAAQATLNPPAQPSRPTLFPPELATSDPASVQAYAQHLYERQSAQQESETAGIPSRFMGKYAQAGQFANASLPAKLVAPVLKATGVAAMTPDEQVEFLTTPAGLGYDFAGKVTSQANTLAGALNRAIWGYTTPASVATLAGGAGVSQIGKTAARLVSLGFGAVMAKSAAEEAVAGHGWDAALTGLFAAVGGWHGLPDRAKAVISLNVKNAVDNFKPILSEPDKLAARDWGVANLQNEFRNQKRVASPAQPAPSFIPDAGAQADPYANEPNRFVKPEAGKQGVAPDGQPVGFNNFFQSTVANWRRIARPDRPPDFTSGSGSEYWDTGKGVIRSSDHWSGDTQNGQMTVGRVAGAWWEHPDKTPGTVRTGYAPYGKFSPVEEPLNLDMSPEGMRAQLLQNGNQPHADPAIAATHEWQQARAQVDVARQWIKDGDPRGPAYLPKAIDRLQAAEKVLSDVQPYPFEGQPSQHAGPGEFNIPDPQARLNRLLTRSSEVGNPKQMEPIEVAPGVLVGRLTPEQWTDRVQKLLSPQEISESRRWYSDLRQLFAQRYGEANADRTLTAWLITQQKESPSGGVLNLERARDIASGLPVIKKPGLAADRVIAALRGKPLDFGAGADKITDFIDSARGMNTRTIMGHDPRGGAPAVIDIHAARDSGYIDAPFANAIKAKYGVDLPLDQPNNPRGINLSEAQYENAAAYIRTLADHLNKIGFDGGNWTPAEVQAVGWTAIQKLMGVTADTPRTMFEKNTRRVSAELAFGEGAPLADKYPQLADMPYDRLAKVTHDVLSKTISLVLKETGAGGVAHVYGPGGYEAYPVQPSVQSDIIASPETIQDVMDAIGYLAQQSEVWATRPMASGKNAFIDVLSSDGLDTPEKVSSFWNALREVAPDLVGFQPASDGELSGIRIINGDGKWKQGDVRRLFNVIDSVAKDQQVDVHVDHGTVELERRGNDWTKDKEGRGYLEGLDQRGRSALSRRLVDQHRATFEGWLRGAIDKYGGAAPEQPAGEPAQSVGGRSEILNALGYEPKSGRLKALDALGVDHQVIRQGFGDWEGKLEPWQMTRNSQMPEGVTVKPFDDNSILTESEYEHSQVGKPFPHYDPKTKTVHLSNEKYGGPLTDAEELTHGAEHADGRGTNWTDLQSALAEDTKARAELNDWPWAKMARGTRGLWERGESTTDPWLYDGPELFANLSAHYMTGRLKDYPALQEFVRREIGNSTFRPNLARLVGHRAAVEQALSAGKPVPPEVLADYPDLKPPQATQGQPARYFPEGSAQAVDRSEILSKPADEHFGVYQGVAGQEPGWLYSGQDKPVDLLDWHYDVPIEQRLPGTLLLTPDGYNQIAQSIGIRDPSISRGVALHPNEVRDALYRLNRIIQSDQPGSLSARIERVRKMRDALQNAVAESGDGRAFLVKAGGDVQDVYTVMMHERVHGIVDKYIPRTDRGGVADQMKELPGFDKFDRWLGSNYGWGQRVDEALTYMLSGDFRRMGMTPEEANEFIHGYKDIIDKNYGAGTFDQIRQDADAEMAGLEHMMPEDYFHAKQSAQSAGRTATGEGLQQATRGSQNYEGELGGIGQDRSQSVDNPYDLWPDEHGNDRAAQINQEAPAPQEPQKDVAGPISRGEEDPFASIGGPVGAEGGHPGSMTGSEIPIEPPSGLPKEKRMGVLETANALIKTGLVSNPKTLGKIVVSHGSFLAAEEVARVPAAIADAMVSAATGRDRTVLGPDVRSMAHAAFSGAMKGVLQIPQVLAKGEASLPSTGATAAEALLGQMGRFESKTVSPIADAYINTIMRTHSATYRVMKLYAMTRALDEQGQLYARAWAKKNGITDGKLVTEMAKKMANEPSATMMLQAIASAEEATFLNKTTMGSAVEAARNTLPTSGQFVMDRFMPFLRVPFAVGDKLVEYATGSAVGPAKAINQAIHGQFTPQAQRKFAQTFGRGMAGLGVIALGAKLYNDGVMTQMVTDEDKKAVDYAAGKQSGAVKMNKGWLAVAGIAPVGTLLALGASLAHMWELHRTQSKEPYHAVKTTKELLSELPLVRGTLGAADMFDERGSKAALGSLVGQVVPGWMDYLAKAQDTTSRVKESPLDYPKARVPGLSSTLQPRIDILGRPEQQPGAGLSPSPFRRTEEDQGLSVQELLRLGVKASALKRKPDETPSDYTLRLQFVGKQVKDALDQVTADPSWRTMTPDQQRLTLQAVVHNVHSNMSFLKGQYLRGTQPAPPQPEGFGDALMRTGRQLVGRK